MSALDDSKVDDRRNSRVKRRNSGGSISHLLSFWKSVEKKNKPVKTPLPSLRRRKWKPPKKKDNPQRVASPKQNQTPSPQIRTNFDVTVTHEDGEATAVVRNSSKSSKNSRPPSRSPPPPPPRRTHRKKLEGIPKRSPPPLPSHLALASSSAARAHAATLPSRQKASSTSMAATKEAKLRKQRPPEEEKHSDSTRSSSSVKCIVTEKEQRSSSSVSSSYLMDDEDCLAVFGLDNDEDEEEEEEEEGEEEEDINNASGNRHKDAKAPDEVGKRSSSSSTSKKMSTKRHKVEAEIISSEEVYVKNLNELIKHFIHPLKSNQELLDPEDILKLFSNIELLYGFHVVFLADLKKKDKEIHLTFQRMADFLKMYTQYVNSYDVAMTTMHRLNKKKKFKAFLDKQQAAAAQGLMSFLIMPVQRIPRYVLLLKELIKNTNDDDQTKEPLRQSLTKVQDIAAYVNEQKRQMESRTTLLNISARLRNVGHFELFKPDRHLVKKGVLHSWHHKLTKQKQHHFMLFTDVVLWTSPNYHLEGYSGFEQLKLDQVSVNLSKSSRISAISNNSTRSSSSSSSSSSSLANNPCTRESSTMENLAIRRGRSHSSRGDDDAISNSHTEEGMNITKEEEGQREFGFRLHIPTSKCRSTFGIGLLRFKEEKPPTFFASEMDITKEWCNAIRETISDYLTNQNERRQRRMGATTSKVNNRSRHKRRRPKRSASVPRKTEDDEEDDHHAQNNNNDYRLPAYNNLVNLKLDQLRKLNLRAGTLKAIKKELKDSKFRTSPDSTSARVTTTASSRNPTSRTLNAEDFPLSPAGTVQRRRHLDVSDEEPTD